MRSCALAAAAGLLLFPLASRADLTGDTIHLTYNFPEQTTVFEDDGLIPVPGAGESLGEFTVTLTGNQVLIFDTGASGFSAADFNGFVLTDVTSNPMIASTTLDPSSTITGEQITFTGDTIYLNFEGLDAAPGDFALFNMTFASSPTPEPASFALLGTGLLGAAGAMRRRMTRA